MAKTYSRLEFYELVWSKPVSHLAKDFRLSDVAIHKICRKHCVPTPPPGWWAKKQAGKEVVKTALPEQASLGGSTITISMPEICSESEVLAEAREIARIAASAALPADPPNKHLVIEATIAALKGAKPSYKGLVSAVGPNVVSCEISPASVPRLQSVLYGLIASAEIQGFILNEGARQAEFLGRGQTISISINETFRRVKHAATAKEQSAVAAWQRRRSSIKRLGSWGWDDSDPYPGIPDWDYECTGRLGIELSKVYMPGGHNPRSTWRDGKTQRLEELAPEISIGMVVLATAQQEAERLQEEAEKASRQARLVREKPYREKHISKRREECLDLILAEMTKLEYFRKLIERLHATFGENNEQPQVIEFLRWSGDELRAREERLTPQGLQLRFEQAKLFGDDDDHDFVAPYSVFYVSGALTPPCADR